MNAAGWSSTRASPAYTPSRVSVSGTSVPKNSAAEMISIDALTRPARPIPIRTSTCWWRNRKRRSATVVGRDPVLGERRVQVDDVRHDGGAEDAGGQQQAVGALEARDQAGGQVGRHDVDAQHRDQEAEQDHPEQPGDGQLEGPVAAALQGQQRECDHPGDHSAGEQRDAEQQVQRDRAADHLGQVGGDGHQLGLHPHAARHRAGEVVAAQLRAGCARWPDRAWPTASGSAWPAGWPRRSPRAAGSRTRRLRRSWWRSCRGRRRRSQRRTPDRTGQPAAVPDRAPGSRRRSGRLSLVAVTTSPPRVEVVRSDGLRPRSLRVDHMAVHEPGQRPAERAAAARRPGPSAGRRTASCSSTVEHDTRDDAELTEVAQGRAVPVGDPLARGTGRRPAPRRGPSPQCSSCGPSRGGIGSPCGSCVGWPRAASMRSSSRSDRACSSSSASACTSSHGTSSMRCEERLQQPVPAHHAQRGPLAGLGQVQRAAVRAGQQAAVLQPLDHGRHRRRGHAELVRQLPGGDRLAAMGEVVDRLEVVLGRPGHRHHDDGL